MQESGNRRLARDSKFLFLLAIFSAMLLPRIFRILGWILLLPALILCFRVQFEHYVIPFLNFSKHPGQVSIFEGISRRYDYSDEVTTTLFVTVLLFIAFGKLKNENALTGKIRMQAFYWSAVITWAATALYLAIGSLPFVAPKSRWLDFVAQAGAYAVLNNFLIPIVFFIPLFGFLRRRVKQGHPLKQRYLLRYMPFNPIGKGSTLLFLLLGIVSELFSTEYNIYSDIFLLLPAALVFWTCSKERMENEVLFGIRLNALQISFFLHYVLFVVTYWLVYGWDYFDALFCSIITMQLIFLIVFYWMKYKLSKQTEQELPVQPHL
jgi:hypothetical protein